MTNNRASHYSSRRHQSMGRNQNNVAHASNVKLGPVAHTVLIALMITVLGLIYLTQATRATSYDYEAQKVDSQIAELIAEKSDLAVENARLTSLESISDNQVARQMSEPADIQYVRE